MEVHLCFEKDIVPFGLTEDEREYIAWATAEYERIANTPPCPICGESASFFKNDQCPYINAEDHRPA